MKLRDLELKDAPFMLEWMHDKSVIKNFRSDFQGKTLDDVITFIISAKNKNNNICLAIASDDDEYMGTVSLKNIDRNNNSAEFAIAVRNSAMGRGYAWYGMEEIIRKAFEEYDLEIVYWCVSRKNDRAIRFYDKHNFHEALDISETILSRYKNVNNLKWYSVLKGDVLDERKEIVGCKIVHIKTLLFN